MFVRSSSQSASNLGPPSVRQRNAIWMAFRWRADSGPILHAYWDSLRHPYESLFPEPPLAQDLNLLGFLLKLASAGGS